MLVNLFLPLSFHFTDLCVHPLGNSFLQNGWKLSRAWNRLQLLNKKSDCCSHTVKPGGNVWLTLTILIFVVSKETFHQTLFNVYLLALNPFKSCTCCCNWRDMKSRLVTWFDPTGTNADWEPNTSLLHWAYCYIRLVSRQHWQLRAE